MTSSDFTPSHIGESIAKLVYDVIRVHRPGPPGHHPLTVHIFSGYHNSFKTRQPHPNSLHTSYGRNDIIIHKIPLINSKILNIQVPNLVHLVLLVHLGTFLVHPDSKPAMDHTDLISYFLQPDCLETSLQSSYLIHRPQLSSHTPSNIQIFRKTFPII